MYGAAAREEDAGEEELGLALRGKVYIMVVIRVIPLLCGFLERLFVFLGSGMEHKFHLFLTTLVLHCGEIFLLPWNLIFRTPD